MKDEDKALVDRLTIRLTKTERQELERAAEEDGRASSNLVRYLVQQFLKGRRKSKP